MARDVTITARCDLCQKTGPEDKFFMDLEIHNPITGATTVIDVDGKCAQEVSQTLVEITVNGRSATTTRSNRPSKGPRQRRQASSASKRKPGTHNKRGVFPCPEPGCTRTSITLAGVGSHRVQAHNYKSPQRIAQENRNKS